MTNIKTKCSIIYKKKKKKKNRDAGVMINEWLIISGLMM